MTVWFINSLSLHFGAEKSCCKIRHFWPQQSQKNSVESWRDSIKSINQHLVIGPRTSQKDSSYIPTMADVVLITLIYVQQSDFLICLGFMSYWSEDSEQKNMIDSWRLHVVISAKAPLCGNYRTDSGFMSPMSDGHTYIPDILASFKYSGVWEKETWVLHADASISFWAANRTLSSCSNKWAARKRQHRYYFDQIHNKPQLWRKILNNVTKIHHLISHFPNCGQINFPWLAHQAGVAGDFSQRFSGRQPVGSWWWRTCRLACASRAEQPAQVLCLLWKSRATGMSWLPQWIQSSTAAHSMLVQNCCQLINAVVSYPIPCPTFFF